MSGWIRVVCLAAALMGVAQGAQASAVVHFVLGEPDLALGQSTSLEIRADLDTPVLGFGIDLLLDPAVLGTVGVPVIGPDWTAVFAPDGDGLAGLAPVTGVVGADVLLATLTVMRTSISGTTIDGAVTPGDLTEGFPLLAGGFDTASFVPLLVTPVPEPGAGLLLGLGLASLAIRQRGRR